MIEEDSTETLTSLREKWGKRLEFNEPREYNSKISRFGKTVTFRM